MRQLRLFCPAEATDWHTILQTDREIQLCKDIASRLGLAIRIDYETGKLYLGRGRGHQLETDKPGPVVRSVNLKGRVKILAQQAGDTCGVCSCAMAVNTITGTNYNDLTWDARHRNKYGVDLFSSLQQDCPKHNWKDVGRPRPEVWQEVLNSLAAGCPAVCGVNGPDFSPSGRGHIVCIIGVTTTTVIFADPNGGELRELARERFEQAQEYPQGNFIFLALPE